jgi:2-polyprenyl-3-methyl-5-hydroxy-6-metoxy-1,4-benzoquinol methylase
MGSFREGKEFITGWIQARVSKGSTCLDVGACDGIWYDHLHDWLEMDAVEIYQPNIDRYRLCARYRNTWCADILDFKYDWYDVIIFGDVIEHMTVEDAQKVLEYASPRCKELIVAVPFLYRQGAAYGNRNEIHIQEDLTPELFKERYPGFQMIYQPLPNYAYYAKKAQE